MKGKEFKIPLSKYNPVDIGKELLYTCTGAIDKDTIIDWYNSGLIEDATFDQRRIVVKEGIYYPDYEVLINENGFTRVDYRIRVFGIFNLFITQDGSVFYLDDLEYAFNISDVPDIKRYTNSRIGYNKLLYHNDHGLVTPDMVLSLCGRIQYKEDALKFIEDTLYYKYNPYLWCGVIPVLLENEYMSTCLYLNDMRVVDWVPPRDRYWRNSASTIYVDKVTGVISARCDDGKFLTKIQGTTYLTKYPLFDREEFTWDDEQFENLCSSIDLGGIDTNRIYFR